MEKKLIEIDAKIFKITKLVENVFLDSINPINSERQRKLFFSQLANHQMYAPCFEYNIINAFEKEKDQLKIAKKEVTNSLAGKILSTRIDSLLSEIELLENINSKNFCRSSKAHYGEPKSEELKKAKEALNSKTLTAKKIVKPEELQEQLTPRVKPTGFSVKLKENMSAKAAVNLSKQEISLNKNSLFTPLDLERLYVHEVETHIYRYLNGLTQPLQTLSLGCGGTFLKTEEGLALYNEKTSGVSSKAQEKVFAGRLYAVDFALRHDFFETFDELRNYFDEEDSYSITQRVKRGVPNGMKGAFTKDHCYYSGILELEQYANSGKPICDLYYGKISSKEAGIVKQIKGLVEPKFIPSYLKQKN